MDIDSSAPQDKLVVTRNPAKHLRGTIGVLDRYLTVPNPSQSGYVVQRVQVFRNGKLVGEYWEAWPVELKDGKVHYADGTLDSFMTRDVSRSRGSSWEQKIVGEAYFIPGYQLDPTDGWQRDHPNTSAGILMSTGKSPTGFPPSGAPVTDELTVSQTQDVKGDASKPRAVTVSTPGQTPITAPLPPYRP